MSSDAHDLDLLGRQLTQLHRNAVSAELAARNLSEVGHPMLLTILETSEAGSCEAASCQAQRDLAEMLCISPSAVSTSLRSLERGGYITRIPGASDARRVQVQLTEKGKAAVRKCREAFDAVSVRMLAGFSDQELGQLIQFRQRMLHNLQT